MTRVEPNGYRYRHFHDLTGRLVATICTRLDPVFPNIVWVAAAVCSLKDTPSKKKGRMIATNRMHQGFYRQLNREHLKLEIAERKILDYFDCGPLKGVTLRPVKPRG